MMNYFFKKIDDPDSNNYEIRSAIQGLGIFAVAYDIHLSEHEILKMFIYTIQRVECLYILNPDRNDDMMQYLPSYIHTISALMGQLGNITDNQMLCFQRVLIIMVRAFPFLSQLHHKIVTDAFVSTLYQVNQSKSSNIRSFISTVIHQSIIWTCSHQYPLEIDDIHEEKMKAVSYKKYLPFWQNLFKTNEPRKYSIFAGDETVTIKAFDEFMTSLFVLLNKLNLNTKLKENSIGFTNPENSLDLVQANDYEIFLNLADFYTIILECVDHTLLKKWINMFADQIILKTSKNPLMSGLYKLLATCFKICDKLHYFDNYKDKESRIMCFESVQSFIKDMLWRMKQYNGDLQVSCFKVLLATPPIVISDILLSCVPSFLTLFSIGRNYFDLAHMGLNTLQCWKNYLPDDKFTLFMEQIVPAFDSYLRSKSLQHYDSNFVLKTRKTKQVLRKQKVLVESEPELLRLQKKVLIFVAQLNNDLCYEFVRCGSNIEPAIYNKKHYLKVSLPYENVPFDLYLDAVVPRIVELALYCSNRKIRMTACELLQATTAVFLGTSKFVCCNLLLILILLVRVQIQQK